MQNLRDTIKSMLIRLGIKDGDTVFVHAGVGPMTKMVPGADKVSVQDALDVFHDVLVQTVGERGTVAAPGFFYDYARKAKPFILEQSPPDRSLGFYPMHLFKQESCKRSLNPIANVLAVGAHADEICAHTSAFAFGMASPWAALLEKNAKCLVIGLPFMMTFIHHIEALVGPPHIYNKIFRTSVVVDGQPISLPVIASVRYLDFDIGYKDDRPEALLREAGAMTEVEEGGVSASVTSFRDALRLMAPEIAKDTSFTLRKAPVFVAGKIPDDGAQS